MAKSSFKTEHPLGSFLSIFSMCHYCKRIKLYTFDFKYYNSLHDMKFMCTSLEIELLISEHKRWSMLYNLKTVSLLLLVVSNVVILSVWFAKTIRRAGTKTWILVAHSLNHETTFFSCLFCIVLSSAYCFEN